MGFVESVFRLNNYVKLLNYINQEIGIRTDVELYASFASSRVLV